MARKKARTCYGMLAASLIRHVALMMIMVLSLSHVNGTDSHAAPGDEVVQRAVINESFGYVNLTQRGGRPSGPGVDNDGPPPLQPASMQAIFSNFSLNGISFVDWQACRSEPATVDQCLDQLVADRDGDGIKSLRDLHPGEIGGDLLAFDVTITNTSPAGVILTNFAFQSKFSESPALGSRIGDKLFKAVRDGLTTGAPSPLGGVKKNGTSNGLFGGKVKFICVNSSTDYPAELNAGTENETLECAGGRGWNGTGPQLQSADGTFIDSANIALPKGLRPGESQTIRIVLDAGTDDGALQRAHGGSGPTGNLGPLTGTLNTSALLCPTLVPGSGSVVEIVDFGDVKILRDSAGLCAPSFYPFGQNQFLTIPRRNWAFTDILDTRDTYLPGELPTVITGHTGKFSFLDVGNLRLGELNFAEILKGFGEFGATLDPSCASGGSRAGSCGGAAYVPFAEFYAIASGKLVRQEVTGSYTGGSYNGVDAPTITAMVDTSAGLPTKTEDPFEIPGNPNPGPTIGASATAEFFDVEVFSDDKTTIPNEGGQAGGDRVRFSVTITNTSPADSRILLTSFNFQTKRRTLTDINDNLDGTSIVGRQDLRQDSSLPDCIGVEEVRCWDADLQIGRFPNVIGNSLLSAEAVSGLETGRLESIKKNGPFQPLADGFANFICIKSGELSTDSDSIESCTGSSGSGLAPGESQTVRLELDYGDFRGLILRVAPGTLLGQAAPFGLVELRGDFDCRDQRRLPYCHPDLVGDDWFCEPTTLADVEFITVHQPGDAPSVMNFTENFGAILAMAGFRPTAEFWQEDVQVQVAGVYCRLPGGEDGCEDSTPDSGEAPENQPPMAVIEFLCNGLTCQFEGTSSADADGTVVAYAWDFGDGGISSAAEPMHSYGAGGTYTVVLTVMDNEGASGTAQTRVQVMAPAAADITLRVEAFRVQGIQHARLLWSGTSAGQIDVYRDGNFIVRVPNTGQFVDNINRRGAGSYTYRVCEAGTTVCSNTAVASFQ
jgi:hypothetical protein